MFSTDQARAWLEATGAAIEANATALTKLDQAIGDGDHGTNMVRGFKAVGEKLPSLADAGFGALFKGVSVALIGKVGGASGPLYGSFYLGLSKAMADAGEAAEVDDAAFAAGLRAGLDAVVSRGKAQLEDKTMVDALTPAMDALDAALADGRDLGDALDAAAAGADEGKKATIPLIARKGRASYLGERSRDHQDPGATSSHLLMQALADVVNGRGGS
jgi:dihydroxyacetone kinase-like protein